MEKFLSNRYVAMLGAVICTVLWGSAYPVIKYAYQTLNIETVPDKLLFAGIRFLTAGFFVFLVSLRINKKIPVVPKNKIRALILFGVFQTGFAYLFNYIGVSNTTATKTSLLTAMSAFLAVLFAPLFFKAERLSAYKIIGCILGFIGILVVNIGAFSGGFSIIGEGFVMIACLSNVFGSFIGKTISKGRVFEVTAYQLMIGSAVLILPAIFLGCTLAINFQSVCIILYLAFVSAAAFSIWTALLSFNEAGKILIFNLLIPVTGAIWSYFILGEKEIFTPLYLVSVILICLGIVFVNLKKA